MQASTWKGSRAVVRLLAAACVLVPLLTAPPGADAGIVPEAQQLPIFFKLLTYDRTLAENDGKSLSIALLVREDRDETRASAEAFAAALREQHDKTVNGRTFDFRTVAWSDRAALSAALVNGGAEILYVPRGCDGILEEIKSATRDRDVLTLAADPDDVREGLSIGLDLRDGRPRILVNLESLHEEGHDLESRALRLCEVMTKP